ncbi:Prevent-host-death family protein (modular protein) [Planktothrix paucivesiculata PCC 9631]|uniref:Antitoxin n=2 Tax=Planktothrix TaxID=54304 RepID=A0A7Z9E117_9CYAN|nr:Prevent-host-death family protein (modular protein) [Planktothrix paucivesiculata PCC 9631]
MRSRFDFFEVAIAIPVSFDFRRSLLPYLDVHLDVQIDSKIMLSNIPITEARNELTSLPEKLAQQGGTLAITRRGKPVLAVMTWEHYEAILETIEILGDANLMANLRQGITEAKSAQGIDWESAKRELDL